jgi:signal transduction histidine kinase
MDRTAVERYRLSLFGRMIMGVAHEVDNHLSVILGFSELIQIAAGNEQKVRDGAVKILAAGERTGAIIRNYSRYVRLHPPAREAFSPGEMVREILSFARYDLGRNNVTLSAPTPVHAGLLHGDRSDLALALLALLFNGSEAMGAGGGELGLSVENGDGGWEFTVSDRGTGIPAGLEEKVFEEGFTTRGEPYHAGMGLPVARRLVGEAGGTLALRNRPGGGCLATIRVPAGSPG